MATSWGSFSPQQSRSEEGNDEDDDEDDVDAYNRSSHLSTPAHETIHEEDEEEDDELAAHPFDPRDSAEFSIALQELKSIRSHLYSAADYCESAYIYSDQKQAILENLKDYSVKALVNAVDHVGTVASKLDDLLSKRTKEMSILEFNVSRVSQQIQAYRDNAICEGLNHYQFSRRRPKYGQHYALAAGQAFGRESKSVDERWIIVQNISQPGPGLGQRHVDSGSDSNTPKSPAWHMAPETPLLSSGRSTPSGPDVVSRSTSSNSRGDKKLPGFLTRSMSGGQFSSPRSSPTSNILDKLQEPGHSPVSSSKTLSSLLSMDEIKHHESQTHKKGLLSTFLGRTKSAKPKRLSTLSSFK